MGFWADTSAFKGHQPCIPHEFQNYRDTRTSSGVLNYIKLCFLNLKSQGKRIELVADLFNWLKVSLVVLHPSRTGSMMAIVRDLTEEDLIFSITSRGRASFIRWLGTGKEDTVIKILTFVCRVKMKTRAKTCTLVCNLASTNALHISLGMGVALIFSLGYIESILYCTYSRLLFSVVAEGCWEVVLNCVDDLQSFEVGRLGATFPSSELPEQIILAGGLELIQQLVTVRSFQNCKILDWHSG